MSKKKTEVNPDCADRLNKLLKRKGMTQKALADLAGYTPATVCGVIREKRPLTFALAQDFAKALNVRPDFLLCNDDYETEAEKQKAEERHAQLSFIVAKDVLTRDLTAIFSILMLEYHNIYIKSDYFQGDTSDNAFAPAPGFIPLTPEMYASYLTAYLRVDGKYEDDTDLNNKLRSDNSLILLLTAEEDGFIFQATDFYIALDPLFRAVRDFARLSASVFYAFGRPQIKGIDGITKHFIDLDDLNSFINNQETAGNVD